MSKVLFFFLSYNFMHVLTYLFCAGSFANAYIELMVKYASRTWISVEKF